MKGRDYKCFQYAATIALNHEEIKKDTQRITKIKPFISKYNWKGIHFPSEKDDWKKFENNNVTMFCMLKKKKYVLLMFQIKHNIIPNGEKREAKSEGRRWHYKKSALLRGITSKHHGNLYCLNCLHSFATENKRESHKKDLLQCNVF